MILKIYTVLFYIRIIKNQMKPLLKELTTLMLLSQNLIHLAVVILLSQPFGIPDNV